MIPVFQRRDIQKFSSMVSLFSESSAELKFIVKIFKITRV